MEQLAREDIAAAAAAHRELGPHYDGAVAESLVDRIGEEIDKRVEARLGDRPQGIIARRRRPDGQLGAAQAWAGTVLAIGSMGIGVGATAAVLDLSRTFTPGGGISNNIGSAQVVLCLLIWAVIGAINISYSRRR